RHMELPEEIQLWVHDYYYYLWYHHKGRVIQGLLDDLPFVLLSDVSSCCHKPLFKKAKIFRDTEHGFKRALSLRLKTYMYSPGHVLAKTGEINQNLYYIKHGLLQTLLLYKIPRNVTVRTLTLCEITVLKHNELLSLLADYPEGLFSGGWAVYYLAVDGLVNIVALFDILVNLRTGVFTEDGLETDFAIIFEAYRRSWDLYYDVLAVLPLELIYLAFGGTEHLRIFGLVKLILIHRIYKHFCQNERDIYKNIFEQRIAKCLFILIFYVHFCAGLMYLSACYEESCNEESWAWNAGLKYTQSKFDQYIYAAYWTTTTITSVGYGDIVPGSLVEQCVAAVVGLIGLLILNYIVSQMSATLSGENANRVNFQNLFLEMHHFMERHKLKASLQIRVLNYMNLLWSKYQYASNLFYSTNIKTIPYFAEAGESFMLDLALTSVLYFFPKGEIIQYTNTFTRELFCIMRGSCQKSETTLEDKIIVAVHLHTFIETEIKRILLERKQIEEFQSECCETLMETAAKVLKRQCKDQESDAVENEKVPLTFHGRRYSKKSKCYTITFQQLYLMSLYYVTASVCSVGFGDIHPYTTSASHEITGPLYDRVIGFYTFRWMRTKGFDQDKLSEYLPSSLVSDISTVLYSDFIAKMYFIDEGEVSVLSNNESAVLFKLNPGQYFGERSFLLEEPRPSTARAETNCDLYVLSKASLDELLKHYPNIYEEMISNAETIKQLLPKEDPRKKCTKPDSEEETFLRAESGKLYRDRMAEEEHRAKLRSRPLVTRLCTSISSTFIQFFLKIFNNMRSVHNKTIVPENSFRVVYQYISCLLITIVFWAITFMPAVFDVNWYLLLLTQVVEFLQICEVFLKFHFSYYDIKGTCIKDYRSASRNYMKRKLGYVFDMVCSFPYGLLVMHHMKKEPADFLPMIIYVRIGHLPRIISLLVFMWKEEQSVTSNVLYIRMIKYFVHSILFVHCATVLCISFVESHGVMSWITETEIYDFTEMYRYATYWLLQIYTTTGYGDIKATHIGEVMACVLLMILSKIQVIYKIGLLIATQTNKITRQEAFEEKLQTIQGYMKHERIPSTLQNRVTRCYSYQWNRTRGTRAEVLFKGIPRSLKIEIVSRICIQHFKKHEFFSHFTEPVLRELSTRILFRCFPAGEYIYRKGDICTAMYVIIIGKVNLCLDTRGKNTFQRLSAGAAFGDHALLQTKHHETAVAANYVDIAILSKDFLYTLNLLYPAAVSHVLKKASDTLQL
ncbi:Cyclic nucleotide-gated cation channel subunit A, partial [Anabarilius grahami]